MAKNQKCGNDESNMAAIVKISFLCVAPYLKCVSIRWSIIVGSFIRIFNFARFSVFVHISVGLPAVPKLNANDMDCLYHTLSMCH